MPRGRPKGSKNAPKVKEVELFEEKDEIKEVKEIKKTDNKVKCYCTICGNAIYSSPRIIRLNQVTAMPEYHRECNVERLELCYDCCCSLNDTIDKWILKNNSKLNKYS